MGQGRSKSVTITRPANTTAYTAEDAIGDVSGSAIIEFPGLVAPGSLNMILSAYLEYDVAALPTGADFRLELYNDSPTAIADNAAWSLLSGDRTKHIGSIDFDTLVDRVATLKVDMDKLNKAFWIGAAGSTGGKRSLYGILVASGGFTPAGNSEVLVVTLTAAPI